MTPPPAVHAAIVQVGAGRGFVTAAGADRFIVTAAHCLPTVPEPTPARYESEATFRALVGPLDTPTGTITVSCYFLDAIADVAVLGTPDSQTYPDEAGAYEAFVEACGALPIAAARAPALSLEMEPTALDISALALQGDWRRGVLFARQSAPIVWTRGVEIAAGMSGSPLVDDTGHARAICSIGSMGSDDPTFGMHPALPNVLPLWFVDRLRQPLEPPEEE